jgi:hypothetical protein
MVAVAHIMNATLVIPQLDRRSFWQDSRYFLVYSISASLDSLDAYFILFQCFLLYWALYSVFSDIFDEFHFIESLKGDIRIVHELPKTLEDAPRARKHFTSWSGVGYYEEMTRLWNDYQVLKSFFYDEQLLLVLIFC